MVAAKEHWREVASLSLASASLEACQPPLQGRKMLSSKAQQDLSGPAGDGDLDCLWQCLQICLRLPFCFLSSLLCGCFLFPHEGRRA